jgi:phage gp36-like protein
MAYAAATDLIARFDTQLIGDLITDDDGSGEREPPDVAAIEASEVLEAMLDDASGRVDAALRVGKRYTPDQLSGLTGNALSHLKRIVCSIAMALLFDRRPQRSHGEIADRMQEQADKYLVALQKGENILGLADETDVNAGLISTSGPTALDLQTRNLLDERMHRYLPSGSTRLPIGR